MHDIIIIGGGPAGMTAALYALRNSKSVLVLEKNAFGGQATYSPKIENFPGTAQMGGSEFADRLLDQILNLGAQVEVEKAVSLAKDGQVFTVETEEGGAYQGRAVILATGVKHRMLGLDGEEELVGNGISFCALCDGDFYANASVAVAGGGNSALQEAVLLSGKCKEVTILQDLPSLTGERKLAEILEKRDNVRIVANAAIKALRQKDGALSGVEYESKEDGTMHFLPCDGLFVAIGLVPENGMFSNLCELDARGYFASGEDCLTRTEGLFVAGDCRAKAIRQITTAAADGSVAATAATRYIDSL